MYLSFGLLITLLAYLILRWWQVKNYWAKRNVPFIPPHPIMGNLTFLQKKNPAVWMREVYKDYPKPYVGIWLFWRPALIINCPNIARNILSKDFEIFRNRLLSSGASDTLGGCNLFTVNDPFWSYIRRKLSPMFTTTKLKFVQNITIVKCYELVKRMKREIKNGERIDIRDNFTALSCLQSLYSDFTTDVISKSMFGVTSDSIVTGDSDMRKATRSLMSYNWRRGLAMCSIFFMPELTDVFRFTFFPKDVRNYLTKAFSDIVQERGGYDSMRNEQDEDLVDFLIKSKQTAAKENKDITEEMLVAQAAILLQAGFDTTSVALSYATYELAFQPEMQEKLYKEVSEAKRNIEGADFDMTTLKELPYLNAVIKEILRKYPTMGWLDRIADRDYKIDDNLTIKAGTTVYVNGNGLHYDAKYFPDPDAFNPDRFMPENRYNLVPFTYMPFGEGPRSCIGSRFGMINMLFALSTAILNFTWKPYPNSLLPNDVELEKQGLFLIPGTILSVDFSLRN